MPAEHKETKLFKDSVTDLNEGYRNLLQYEFIGDLSVGKLKHFEHQLSPALPGKMLHNWDEYKKLAEQFPLPPGISTRVDPEVFDQYVWLYESIMRKANLLDKDMEEDSPKDEIEAFDLGGF